MSYFNTPRAFSDEIDGSPVFDGSATVLGFVPASGTYTITRPLLCNKISVTGTTILRMTNGTLGNNGTIVFLVAGRPG